MIFSCVTVNERIIPSRNRHRFMWDGNIFGSLCKIHFGFVRVELKVVGSRAVNFTQRDAGKCRACTNLSITA